MEKRKVVVLNMLNAVMRFFNAQRNTLEQWLPLKSAISTFSTRLKALNQTAEMADALSGSVTAGKQELKRILAYELALIAAQAHSWALLEGIQEVIVATDFSEKELSNMPDKKLQSTGGHLLKTVQSHNGEMGDYKVEDTMLNNAKQLLETFAADVQAPRNVIAGKSSSLKRSYAELAFLHHFLENSLDRLMVLTRKTNPELYGEYLVNREVVDSGSRETRIAGQVTGQDGKPLAKVNITAEETDKGYRYETITDSNGNFVLKITEAGRYKIIFSHSQYNIITENNFSISPGDQPRMNKTMIVA